MANDVRQRLLDLLEPLLTQLGYELVDLVLVAGRRDSQLAIFIDRAGGVTVADCERVSGEVSAVLEVHDPIPGSYALEVSSPGLDRALRTPAHFARFVGERVWVELVVPREGRRRYTGKLTRSDEVGIEVWVDGKSVSLRYPEIGRARLSPEWPVAGRKRT